MGHYQEELARRQILGHEEHKAKHEERKAKWDGRMSYCCGCVVGFVVIIIAAILTLISKR